MFLQQANIPQSIVGGGTTGAADGFFGGAAGTQQLNVLEAEVPTELLTQLSTLENAIRENKSLYAQIKDTNPANELQELEAKVLKVGRLITQQKSAIKEERMKSAALAEKVGLDQRIAQNIQKCRAEQQQQAQQPSQTTGMASGIGGGGMANPMLMMGGTQFGGGGAGGGRLMMGIVPHSLDYLHEMAAINERQLEEQWATVQRLQLVLNRLLRQDEDDENLALSHRDLAEHIQRFDKIFETVALQVYSLSEASEKLRDSFMEYRKLLGGSAIVDPFERRKQRQRMVDAYSALKGVDAFPSPNAIMSLSEFLRKQQQLGQIPGSQQAQFGTTPFAAGTFGAAGIGGGTSLFGAAPRPAAPPAFSFNQPALSAAAGPTGTVPSLFGGAKPAATQAGGISSLFGGGTTPTSGTAIRPAGAPQTALPGTMTAPPAFQLVAGQQQQAQQQPQQQATVPPFGFSNTLSSASSGTLFKGSAPVPATPFGMTAAGTTKPSGGSLFGAK